MVRGVIFGEEYLILATKTKMLGKQFFWVSVWAFWGSDGAPDGWEMVDTSIPDRFEIG